MSLLGPFGFRVKEETLSNLLSVFCNNPVDLSQPIWIKLDLFQSFQVVNSKSDLVQFAAYINQNTISGICVKALRVSVLHPLTLGLADLMTLVIEESKLPKHSFVDLVHFLIHDDLNVDFAP